MDQRERINDREEALQAALDGRQAEMWTAIPGILSSVNLTKMTCEVQPAIQARLRNQDGSWSWVTLPLVVDCPIVFPSGGGFTLTFPLQAGDEVMIIFASRCIDAWWQQGGVQQQLEMRMHDLSDGFVFPGLHSQPNVLENISVSTVQLRSKDGTTFVEITDNQVVNIAAPSGLFITGDVTITGQVTASGEGIFNGGHTVSAHKHGGVTTGAGQTGTPTG